MAGHLLVKGVIFHSTQKQLPAIFLSKSNNEGKLNYLKVCLDDCFPGSTFIPLGIQDILNLEKC